MLNCPRFEKLGETRIRYVPCKGVSGPDAVAQARVFLRMIRSGKTVENALSDAAKERGGKQKSLKLPPPDPAKVEEARKRAEERGLAWLLHGAARTLAWYAGLDRVKQEIADARMEICKGCDQYGDGVKCKACGCPFKKKLTDAKEVCPLGKW